MENRKAVGFVSSVSSKNSVINVVNPLQQKVNYKLYNAKGRLINSGLIRNNQIQIGDLSSGNYFISLIGEQSILNRQIVVE